jgi:hypothetical protein
LEHETGNPVFDYRANYRKSAEKFQYWLIFAGILMFAGCGVAFLFGKITEHLRLIMGIASLCGILLIVCGVLWAFYWRNKLNAEFREKFGPK